MLKYLGTGRLISIIIVLGIMLIGLLWMRSNDDYTVVSTSNARGKVVEVRVSKMEGRHSTTKFYIGFVKLETGEKVRVFLDQDQAEIGRKIDFRVDHYTDGTDKYVAIR